MKFEKLPFGANLISLVRKFQRRNLKFEFEGKAFNYFINAKNKTYNNERTVEVALAQHFYRNCNHTIELGNVSSQYFKSNFEIIDKYEKKRGVKNQDFLELDVSKYLGFDFLSISTIEHIAWDEFHRYSSDDNTSKKVMEHKIHDLIFKKITKIAGKDGRILITVPFGYNKYLDRYIQSKLKMEFPNLQVSYLSRINMKNEWAQCSDINSLVGYAAKYPAANSIYVIHQNLFNQ